MKINASRMIDTLEGIIAIAGVMDKELLENAIQGSAVWVSENFQFLTDDELQKIDRLWDRLDQIQQAA